jgi:hypothetical protein
MHISGNKAVYPELCDIFLISQSTCSIFDKKELGTL